MKGPVLRTDTNKITIIDSNLQKTSLRALKAKMKLQRIFAIKLLN